MGFGVKTARGLRSPKEMAMNLLTRREHSRKELMAKLVARGVEDLQARAAIDELAVAGWQDDTRFAGSMVRSRAAGGYGPVRIRAELDTHGLERGLVAEALDAYEGDWLENARALAWRRFGAGLADDRRLQRRAADFLVRRGFAIADVQAAIKPVGLDRSSLAT